MPRKGVYSKSTLILKSTGSIGRNIGALKDCIFGIVKVSKKELGLRMGNVSRKVKRERRRWWKNQSPEKQAAFIEKKILEKRDIRLQRTLETMKKWGNKYPCGECFHGLIKSCTYSLPNGCRHWFNPNSKKKGLASK